MKRDLPLSSLEHDMPHSEDSRGVSAPGKPIGQIIRDVRPLSDADLDHILVVQKRMGVRFGEAAVALALVSQKDVMWALSQQFRYPFPREPG